MSTNLQNLSDEDLLVALAEGAPDALDVLYSRHSGRVLTHKFLIKETWGTYLESDNQTLRVFMANIRKKIESDTTNPKYIVTEVGVGYRLKSE